jgi:hypothetical protein
MRRNVLLGSCLALMLVASGCRDQKIEPTGPSAGASPEFSRSLMTPRRLRLDRTQIKLPAGVRMSDRQFAEAARRAIDPTDYVCVESTPVIDWYITEVTEFIVKEPALFDLLYVNLFADLIPTYEALYFLTEDTPQYFGYHGEYTQKTLKAERDVKRFWDIQSADIQLVGMHGTVLQDIERTAVTYELLFGVDHAEALDIAATVKQALNQSQVLDGGNHPLFSFNAFAISAPGLIPDKIVMGDGFLAGYKAVGLDDVALPAVYAHEFGHHIQYENGYFNDPYATSGSGAEQTRYTELMADAFSAYYLTHKRGAAMNRKRVEQFLEVFFEIGDCAFDDPGHHGTQFQRMRSARFGFNLAEEAQQNGHILTSEQVHARFVAEYPRIVAPDAT